MTATFDLAEIFATLAGPKLRAEEAARTKLAEALVEFDRAVDAGLIREAMRTAANALPYREVLEDAEEAGMYEALDAMRKRLTRRLLTRSMSSSTCQISNEADRLAVDGAQGFLANTEGLLEHAQAAAEVPTPAPEPQPAPAPAAVDVPKATAAQRRTLEAIRDNGVRMQEFRTGVLMVNVKRGTKPRRDMVEWVVEQGWATRDTSRSLFQGQPVSLTEVGEAILAR